MLLTLTEICNEFNVTVEEAMEYVQSENISTIVHTSYEIDKEKTEKYFSKKKDVSVNLSQKIREAETRAKALKDEFFDKFSYESVESVLKDKNNTILLIKGLNDYRALIKYFDRVEIAINLLLDSNKKEHEDLLIKYRTGAGNIIEEIEMFIKLYKSMATEKWGDINTDIEFTLEELLGIEP